MNIRSRYTDTSTGYVKLYVPGLGVIDEHRYIMQNALGRTLDYNEVVHHKDGDKQNNSLSNLVLVDRASHAKTHSATGRTMIELTCACCGTCFRREARQVNTKMNSGQRDFYCRRSCVAKAFGRGRPKNVASSRVSC